MAKKVSYTILRGDTYHFKLRVDDRLRRIPEFASKDFIQFSLKTKDSRVAFDLAAKHHAKITKQLAEFERRGRSATMAVPPIGLPAAKVLDGDAILFEAQRFEDSFFRRLSFDDDYHLEQNEGRSDFGYVGGLMIETWRDRLQELEDPENDETVRKAERIISAGGYVITADEDLALVAALADTERASIEKLLRLSHEERLSIRLRALAGKTETPRAVTVGEIVQNYRDRHPDNEAMLKKLEPALVAWRQLTKTENASRISASTLRSFAYDLAKVPARYQDRFKGMTLPEAIAANAKLPEPFPTLAVKTIRDGYLGPLKTAFSTAKKDELIQSNPFADAGLPTVGRATDRKRAFRTHELNLIFQHPIWTGCKGPSARNTPGKVIIRDHYFWPPLISLFSGMRAEEIADFELTNILLDHTIPHFDAKGTKTENAKRLIPIHPRLIEIGFDDYVRQLKREGHTRLFPHWPKPKSKSRSCGACQRNFNEHVISEDNFDRPTPSFHSFRKTVRTEMERRGMPEGYRKVLLGHSPVGMDKHYLDPELADYSDKFIAAVQYDGLDLKHLRRHKRT
jgi:integrase